MTTDNKTHLTGMMIVAINERVIDALRAHGVPLGKVQKFIRSESWRKSNRELVAEKLSHLKGETK